MLEGPVHKVSERNPPLHGHPPALGGHNPPHPDMNHGRAGIVGGHGGES